MIKLLKGCAIVLVAIAFAYFFLIDNIIKAQLEQRGSQALQAPLTVGQVTFHLSPTSLTLSDIQTADIQIEQLVLPLTLRDLLAHKWIADAVDVHGLHFSFTRDSQLMQQILDPALSSDVIYSNTAINAIHTIDSTASIANTVLTEKFKSLLVQLMTTLGAFATSSNPADDWQILVRRISMDGMLDVAATTTPSRTIRFTGTIDNFTPQPQLFAVVTQFDFHGEAENSAPLHISGKLNKDKLLQVAPVLP